MTTKKKAFAGGTGSGSTTAFPALLTTATDPLKGLILHASSGIGATSADVVPGQPAGALGQVSGADTGVAGQPAGSGLSQSQIVQPGAATLSVEPVQEAIQQPIQESIQPAAGMAQIATQSETPVYACSPEQASKQFGTPAQPTATSVLPKQPTVLPMPESGRNSHPQADDAQGKQRASSFQLASPALKKTGVTFRVMHGYGSATSLHSIAEESANSDKYLTIFYIGDWDPSGMNMSEIDIPGRMQRYDGDCSIEGIALDAGDVGPGTKLPSFDAQSKVGDSRHRWFVDRYGARCWELDALSPVVLRQRVETAILGCLDQEDAWEHSVDVEKAERESMSGFMDTWKSISAPAKKYSLGAAEGGV